MTYLYLFIFYLLLARLSESNMRFFLLKSKEEETSKLLLIWANIICHTFNTLTLDLVLPCFWPVLLARTRDKLAYFRTSLVLFINFNSKLIVLIISTISACLQVEVIDLMIPIWINTYFYFQNLIENEIPQLSSVSEKYSTSLLNLN